MKHGKFVYRVVFNKLNGYCIMQVFEKDGIIYFVSKKPSIPYGNDSVSLKNNLLNYIEAFNMPIINYENIREISTLPAPH